MRTDLPILQERTEMDMNCTVQNCLSSKRIIQLSKAGCSSYNESCADVEVALMRPHIQIHAALFHFATD